MSVDMDEVFAQYSRMPMTAKIGTKIAGRKLQGKNELPLMSQAIANSIQGIIWSLSSPVGQRNVQATIERSVNRKFLPFVNAMSKANRESMHHLYEWNKTGVTSARLFDLKIPSASRGKTRFSMVVDFRPSKSLVPLTEAQQTPGPSGKVVTARHVFYNKAMTMEYGHTVTIRPRTARVLAFDSPNLDGSLYFTKGPIMINYADRPTFGGLQKAIQGFFSGYAQKDINDSVSNYGSRAARAAGKAAHMINVSMPSDAYARAVGSRVAESLAVPGA